MKNIIDINDFQKLDLNLIKDKNNLEFDLNLFFEKKTIDKFFDEETIILFKKLNSILNGILNSELNKFETESFSDNICSFKSCLTEYLNKHHSSYRKVTIVKYCAFTFLKFSIYSTLSQDFLEVWHDIVNIGSNYPELSFKIDYSKSKDITLQGELEIFYILTTSFLIKLRKIFFDKEKSIIFKSTNQFNHENAINKIFYDLLDHFFECNRIFDMNFDDLYNLFNLTMKTFIKKENYTCPEKKQFYNCTFTYILSEYLKRYKFDKKEIDMIFRLAFSTNMNLKNILLSYFDINKILDPYLFAIKNDYKSLSSIKDLISNNFKKNRYLLNDDHFGKLEYNMEIFFKELIHIHSNPYLVKNEVTNLLINVILPILENSCNSKNINSGDTDSEAILLEISKNSKLKDHEKLIFNAKNNLFYNLLSYHLINYDLDDSMQNSEISTDKDRLYLDFIFVYFLNKSNCISINCFDSLIQIKNLYSIVYNNIEFYFNDPEYLVHIERILIITFQIIHNFFKSNENPEYLFVSTIMMIKIIEKILALYNNIIKISEYSYLIPQIGECISILISYNNFYELGQNENISSNSINEYFSIKIENISITYFKICLILSNKNYSSLDILKSDMNLIETIVNNYTINSFFEMISKTIIFQFDMYNDSKRLKLGILNKLVAETLFYIENDLITFLNKKEFRMLSLNEKELSLKEIIKKIIKISRIENQSYHITIIKLSNLIDFFIELNEKIESHAQVSLKNVITEELDLLINSIITEIKRESSIKCGVIKNTNYIEVITKYQNILFMKIYDNKNEKIFDHKLLIDNKNLTQDYFKNINDILLNKEESFIKKISKGTPQSSENLMEFLINDLIKLKLNEEISSLKLYEKYIAIKIEEIKKNSDEIVKLKQIIIKIIISMNLSSLKNYQKLLEIFIISKHYFPIFSDLFITTVMLKINFSPISDSNEITIYFDENNFENDYTGKRILSNSKKKYSNLSLNNPITMQEITVIFKTFIEYLIIIGSYDIIRSLYRNIIALHENIHNSLVGAYKEWKHELKNYNEAQILHFSKKKNIISLFNQKSGLKYGKNDLESYLKTSYFSELCKNNNESSSNSESFTKFKILCNIWGQSYLLNVIFEETGFFDLFIKKMYYLGYHYQILILSEIYIDYYMKKLKVLNPKELKETNTNYDENLIHEKFYTDTFKNIDSINTMIPLQVKKYFKYRALYFYSLKVLLAKSDGIKYINYFYEKFDQFVKFKEFYSSYNQESILSRDQLILDITSLKILFTHSKNQINTYSLLFLYKSPYIEISKKELPKSNESTKSVYDPFVSDILQKSSQICIDKLLLENKNKKITFSELDIKSLHKTSKIFKGEFETVLNDNRMQEIMLFDIEILFKLYFIYSFEDPILNMFSALFKSFIYYLKQINDERDVLIHFNDIELKLNSMIRSFSLLKENSDKDVKSNLYINTHERQKPLMWSLYFMYEVLKCSFYGKKELIWQNVFDLYENHLKSNSQIEFLEMLFIKKIYKAVCISLEKYYESSLICYEIIMDYIKIHKNISLINNMIGYFFDSYLLVITFSRYKYMEITKEIESYDNNYSKSINDQMLVEIINNYFELRKINLDKQSINSKNHDKNEKNDVINSLKNYDLIAYSHIVNTSKAFSLEFVRTVINFTYINYDDLNLTDNQIYYIKLQEIFEVFINNNNNSQSYKVLFNYFKLLDDVTYSNLQISYPKKITDRLIGIEKISIFHDNCYEKVITYLSRVVYFYCMFEYLVDDLKIDTIFLRKSIYCKSLEYLTILIHLLNINFDEDIKKEITMKKADNKIKIFFNLYIQIFDSLSKTAYVDLVITLKEYILELRIKFEKIAVLLNSSLKNIIASIDNLLISTFQKCSNNGCQLYYDSYIQNENKSLILKKILESNKIFNNEYKETERFFMLFNNFSSTNLDKINEFNKDNESFIEVNKILSRNKILPPTLDNIERRFLNWIKSESLNNNGNYKNVYMTNLCKESKKYDSVSNPIEVKFILSDKTTMGFILKNIDKIENLKNETITGEFIIKYNKFVLASTDEEINTCTVSSYQILIIRPFKEKQDRKKSNALCISFFVEKIQGEPFHDILQNRLLQIGINKNALNDKGYVESDENFQMISTRNNILYRAFYDVVYLKDFYEKKLKYIKSHAINSFLNLLIGLGDRHCGNIFLYDYEIRHIDFGYSLNYGYFLTVPETIPFRNTVNFRFAMGIQEEEGFFRYWMIKIFNHIIVNSFVFSGIVIQLMDEHQRETSFNPLVKILNSYLMIKDIFEEVNTFIKNSKRISNLKSMYEGWKPCL